MLKPEYVAGLFDGEGCIYISPNLVGLQVSVTQKKPEILYLLASQYGGSVSKYGKQACHKWRIWDTKEIEHFLQEILPHCLIKRGEVEIGLLFAANKTKGNMRYNPLKKDQLQLRNKLFKELKGMRNGQNVS